MAEPDDGPLINRDARYPIAAGQGVRVWIERRGAPDADAYEGTLLDLSPGGARLGVPISFSFADAVRLKADFGAESALSLEADAEVCWTRPADDGTWIVGCSFTPKMAPDLLQQLASSAIINRRQGVRQPTAAAATASWELGGALIPIQLRNTSSGGFCITSPRCAATGEQVLLHLRKDDDTISFIAARIQWCLRAEDHFVVGCALKDGKDYAVLREWSAGHEPEARVEALAMRLRNNSKRVPAISACVWALAAIAWVVVSMMDHVAPQDRLPSRAEVQQAGSRQADTQQAAVDTGQREHEAAIVQDHPSAGRHPGMRKTESPPLASAPPSAKVTEPAGLSVPDTPRLAPVTSISVPSGPLAPPAAPNVARADSKAIRRPIATEPPIVTPTPTFQAATVPRQGPRPASPKKNKNSTASASAVARPSSVAAAAPSAARYRAAEAQKLYRGGNYQASAEAFRRLLEQESPRPLDHYYLALALYQLGQRQEAAEHVRQGLRLEQTQPIENWGTLMMRNQGRARQWLEQKRLEYKRSAGNLATSVTRAIRESPPAADAPRLVAQ